MDFGDSSDARSVDFVEPTAEIPRRRPVGRKTGRGGPQQESTSSNWGLGLIDGFLYPLAMVATPLFLLALIVFFVFQAFTDGVGDGIRSFAAVLLPLMTIALLVGFRKEELREKKELIQEGGVQAFPSALAFTLTLLAGVGVLALLVVTPTGVPLPELVLSGSFSVLIYSYVALPQDKAMFYYFGMVLGFLLYVVILGFPTLKT